jgi:predicted Zn-dependent peptidase
LEIIGQKNDKRSYAMKRCVEIMCKDEPYGIPRLGSIEDIDGIAAADLYAYYKTAVLTAPFDVFVVGDTDIAPIHAKITEMFAPISVTGAYPKSVVIPTVSEVKTVTETEKIVQGKLSLGFRTKLEPSDAKYPALMLYNAVLGSGIFSKLFNNVREKLSLAYYASSSVDYLKGIMTINSGIEVENFQKCYDEIFVQMDAIKNGDVTEHEFTAAKLGSINNIKSVTDSAFMMEDYYLSRLIIGRYIELDDLARTVEKVTAADVVAVAQEIELDTVYFLKGI